MYARGRRDSDARAGLAAEADGVHWLALTLRVAAITARTSGPNVSRLALRGSSRREGGPIKAISYHE